MNQKETLQAFLTLLHCVGAEYALGWLDAEDLTLVTELRKRTVWFRNTNSSEHPYPDDVELHIRFVARKMLEALE